MDGERKLNVQKEVKKKAKKYEESRTILEKLKIGRKRMKCILNLMVTPRKTGTHSKSQNL